MRLAKLAVPFLIAAAAAILPAGALAASATATGTLTGSTLSLSTSATPSFSANLDLGDSTPTYTVPLTIQDTRGTGAGWNATITSTQFTTGGATPSTLATNASSLTGVTSVCASGTCTNPTNAVAYPVAVPAGSTPPTAVKFFNAAANTGMGKFTNTPTIGVFVPQNSVAGTYTSTLTISIVSGP
jgi:putative surface cell wall-binding protein